MTEISACRFRPLLLAMLACFCMIRPAPVAVGEPDEVEWNIKRLRNKRWDIQETAVEELGRLKDRRAVEPLIPLLTDPVSGVRWDVAEALGAIQDPRAVEPLVAALKDTDSRVRKSAVVALGAIKDPRAVVPLLVVARDDTDAAVRSAALWAVVGLGPPAVEPLILELKDSDSKLGAFAAWALGQIKDARAVEPLIAVMTSPVVDVRTGEAALALGNIKDPRAVGPLIPTLNDADAKVRADGAFALGQLHDPRAVEPLIATLKDVDPQVRILAAQSLGLLGSSDAVPPLISLLADPDANVRRRAMVALGNIKDPRAISPVTAAVKDPDAQVRQTAAEVLLAQGIVVELARDDRFIAYSNGTVLDTKTNLMWAAQDSVRTFEYYGAVAYCHQFRGGGYTDWRVPYVDELAGLYDAGRTRTITSRSVINEPRQEPVHLATELISINNTMVLAAVRPQPGLITVIGNQVFTFQTGKRDAVFGCGNFCGTALPVRQNQPSPPSGSKQ